MRLLLPTAVISLAAVFALAAEDANDAVFQSSVQIVTVAFSAIDKLGRPVPDLQLNELKLLDNGHPRDIHSFSRDTDLPLTLGLVADISSSQSEYIRKHREDLRQFLHQVLHQGDQAFLVSVSKRSTLTVDMTGSFESLDTAVDQLEMDRSEGEPFGGACRTTCGTLLWNGIWGSAKLRLNEVQGRKAILVLSDGQDDGSIRSLSATIEAAQDADTPVYTIGSEPLSLAAWIAPGMKALNMMGLARLKRLSEETGGGYFKATKDPSKIFDQIETELRHLYVLSFALPPEDRDGKFHKLKVESSREGVRVRSRVGYLAQ
jgi:VWFA-related protein